MEDKIIRASIVAEALSIFFVRKHLQKPQITLVKSGAHIHPQSHVASR